MTLIKFIFSKEFLFVMFLFSGTFKESINLPFDIAGLFLALLLMSISWQMIQKPIIKLYWIAPVIFIAILIFIILLSGIFNVQMEAYLEKTLKFVAVTIPAFLLPLLIIKNQFSIQKVFLSISLLSVVLSFFSLPMILSGENLFIGFNEGNYQGLARVTGIGLITMSYFFFIENKKSKVFIFPFLVIVAFVLMSTGSRIPIIAIGVIIVYVLYKSFVFKRKDVLVKKRSLIGIIFAALFSLTLPYFYSNGYFETLMYRFQVLFESDGGDSVSARVERINASLQMFSENIFLGGGFGNFGDYFFGTAGVYSHNMFLEFLSELGIVGVTWFLAFLAFVAFCIFLGYKKNTTAMQTALVSGFLFFFLNAMVSGDINDNRALFSFAAILMAVPNFDTKVKEHSCNEEIINKVLNKRKLLH